MTRRAPRLAGNRTDQETTNTMLHAAWLPLIRHWTNYLRAGDVPASTIRVYTSYVHRLARTFHTMSPHAVGFDELVAFLANPTWKPNTRRVARSAMRSFFQWAKLTSRRDDDPSRLLRPIRVPRGIPRPAPDDAVRRAMAHATCARDRLMVMLGCYAGLRRAEIAVVRTDDIIGEMLYVHGKGGRDRLIPLHPVLVAAIAQLPRGYLFPGLVDGHLSPDRVGRILTDLLGGGWTGHTLRHRFLSLAYLAERDVRAVQELAGHAKLDTTMIYTKVPEGALRRAVLAAGPPAAAA